MMRLQFASVTLQRTWLIALVTTLMLGCSSDVGRDGVDSADAGQVDVGVDAVDGISNDVVDVSNDVDAPDLPDAGGEDAGPRPIEELKGYWTGFAVVGAGDHAFSVDTTAEHVPLDLLVHRMVEDQLAVGVAYLKFWEGAFAIALEGELVATPISSGDGNPPSLMLVDVADPLHPELLSTTSLESKPFETRSWDCFDPRALDFVESRIYVPCRAGLVILDVRNPRRPTIVHAPVQQMHWRSTSISVSRDLTPDGRRLAVVGAFDALHIYDVTDASDVVELHAHEDDDGPVRDVFTDGAHAYVSHEGVLNIWSLANPEEPEKVASIAADHWVKAITVVGDRLYFVEESYFDRELVERIPAYFRVYDVSEPASPEHRCSVGGDELPYTANLIHDAYINGDRVYFTVYRSNADYSTVRWLDLPDLFAGPCAAPDGPGD